jgi:hypothetical protein
MKFGHLEIHKKKKVSVTSAKHFLGNNPKNSPYFEEKRFEIALFLL